MKLIGLSGSLTPRSKTLLAVEKAVKYAKEYSPNIEAEVINLRDYDVQFCDGRDPADYEGDTKRIIDKIVQADALIVGTPVYRGSLTGALKNVFDVIPNDSLKGKMIGFIATGGTYHHFLVLEHQLHPLAGYFSAHVVPGGVYAHNEHYSAEDLIDPDILHRLRGLGESIIQLSYNVCGEYVGADQPSIPRKSLSPR